MERNARRAVITAGVGAMTLAVLGMPGGARAAEQPPAVIHVVSPGVEISLDGATFRSIDGHRLIGAGTTIRTTPQGRARVSYPDGSEVLVAEATTYKIQRLETA